MTNLNDLKIFDAVAANNSFTKAAEVMNTVQSNVTARIRTLEDELGVSLFQRNSRKVELTKAGETLLVYSRQISRLVDKAREALDASGVVSGNLTIGCLETTMALQVPQLIARFAKQYPGINLNFRSAICSRLVEDVLEERLDAAFVLGPLGVSGLKQVRLKQEELVIIAPRRINSIKEVLYQQPMRVIVFDQGCIFRARLEAWLSAKGVMQYQNTVLNSIEGIINFVESDLGISLLPKDLVKQFFSKRKINYIPITKELGMMSTLLIYREDELMPQALKVFIDGYKTYWQ